MQPRHVWLAVAALALAGLFGEACSAKTPDATCNDLCARVSGLSCAPSDCLAGCAQAQQSCGQAGQGSAFQSLLNCESTASFSCDPTSGVPATTSCQSEGQAVASCVGFTQGPPPPTGDGGVPPGDSSITYDSTYPDIALPDTAVPDDADAGPTDMMCGQPNIFSQCATCCENQHFVGQITINGPLMMCVCYPGNVCATECAGSYCQSQQPNDGDPCDLCVRGSIQPDGGCYQSVIVQYCDPSPDCTALINCIDTYCAGKP